MGLDPVGHAFPQRHASTGKVAQFTLASVDRIDHPAGGSYTAPGGTATKMLGCADSGVDVDLAVAFEPGSNFILYAIEELSSQDPFFIFLELESAEVKQKLICEEAFIDRGARMVATLGCRVLVASLATVENYMNTAALEAPIEQGLWSLSIVWNTGRCGSTLMHKALLACGVGSFSEPQWLDQLCHSDAKQVNPLLLSKAFKLCWLMDIHLLRCLPSYHEASKFSLNPKSCGWLSTVAKPFTDAFPSLRHCFMYRACDQVAESFSSLDAASMPPEMLAEADAKWKQQGPPMLHNVLADNLRKPLISGDMPLGTIESCRVARRTLVWLNCINAWIAVQATAEAFAKAPALRMDEFVSKDLDKREAILRETLLHLDVITDGDDAKVKAALEVFKENSQKNSAMGAAKKGGLSEKCRNAIFECIAKVGPLIPGVIIERDGANILIPGSLGTSAEEPTQASKKLRCS
mmetsp:Transcript_59874/g.106470  ORF Transcript_59874/g.106470 Transcript_59874/m.106470 type:complete len:464 (-) Transcript_59874:122-1513(-)|eukprot:CAMPEP_0197626430 /NCGR_PEP_ID=MMETSP1338-20131121/5405_1 /TAXON_ID=43686 ORGANISM="Pelagodinium beii, Strain RCC1491" /NCGR_SAMPLE_ID=MMETSP1338 /ASSEMBLY_ACC=CAM_ASM_000754 /LENGTH=463 /DNA_ID=CAMNT_0043196971 /DNA_START=51 /DNA_END=1442 /DNA_ORIENTATION=-